MKTRHPIHALGHLAPRGLLLTFVLLSGPGCRQEEPAQAPAVTAPPVLVVSVEPRSVTDRIEATGQLVAKAEATVATQVEGQVTAIRVEEGDAVEQSQILLEIDPQRRQLELANAEASVGEAKAQLSERQRELERIRRLSQSNAASQARLDEANTGLALARSRLSGAEARLGLARRMLADSTITAPFAGLVARRNVSVGEYVSTGLPLFEIVALDPVEVEFTLAEVDSARVQVGNEVQVRVAPYPDEHFTAIVTVVAPTIDPMTRTLRVKAELENPEGRLRPGLFAHADLGVSHRENVAMVPEDALVQRADGSVLFKLVRGPDGQPTTRVKRLLVETGVHRDGQVEIRSQLDAGDFIVLRGQGELVDGMAVSLRTRDGRPVEAVQVAAPAQTTLTGVDP
jgi:RND family efflux transporter MFP subunit